jgi:hypothetical protein
MDFELLQKIAGTIVGDSQGNMFFNILCYNAECGDIISPVECG